MVITDNNGSGTPARTHLLLAGWYKPGSGFTRVLQSLLPYLQTHFKVTWLGVGYQGDPIQLHDDVQLLPVNVNGGDSVGAYYARTHWDQLAPDIVLILNDLLYFQSYTREFCKIKGFSAPVVAYLPLDGAIDDPLLTKELSGIDHFITYTHWAANQMQRSLISNNIETPVSVAGHGIDIETFTPLSDYSDCNTRMVRGQKLFDLDEPSFVVLNASRPDPRKRLDLTLQAFAHFAKDKPSHVRLCLHQAIAFDQFVEPLREQAKQLGIYDRIIWFPNDSGPLDDQGLNELYNACAVGLNTSCGEGFGLVSFEHAATGAPQVIPAHDALEELWEHNALLARPVRPVLTEHSPLTMGEVDFLAISNALDSLYSSADNYSRFSQQAITRCTAKDLSWEIPAKRILEVLAKVR